MQTALRCLLKRRRNKKQTRGISWVDWSILLQPSSSSKTEFFFKNFISWCLITRMKCIMHHIKWCNIIVNFSFCSSTLSAEMNYDGWHQLCGDWLTCPPVTAWQSGSSHSGHGSMHLSATSMSVSIMGSILLLGTADFGSMGYYAVAIWSHQSLHWYEACRHDSAWKSSHMVRVITTAQSFSFCVVHPPCNLSLDLFCPASSAQLLCNPHDIVALVTLPHLPSFLSSLLCSHFSEQSIGRRRRWLPDGRVLPPLSSVPPLSPSPKDPAHPTHIHPLNIILHECLQH